MENENISFGVIYKNYFNRVRLFVRSYVHDNCVAEDIASEVIMNVWNATKSTQIHNMDSYVFVVSKNLALNYLRNQKGRTNSLSKIQNSLERELEFRTQSLISTNPDLIFVQEIRTIIDNTLQSLPDNTRKIFIKSRFEGLTNKEIAEQMGLSVKGVEYHISKSLAALREPLSEYWTVLLFFNIL